MTRSEQARIVRLLRRACVDTDEARKMLWEKGTGYGEDSQHWITGLQQCADQLELIVNQIEAANG